MTRSQHSNRTTSIGCDILIWMFYKSIIIINFHMSWIKSNEVPKSKNEVPKLNWSFKTKFQNEVPNKLKTLFKEKELIVKLRLFKSLCSLIFRWIHYHDRHHDGTLRYCRMSSIEYCYPIIHNNLGILWTSCFLFLMNFHFSLVPSLPCP